MILSERGFWRERRGREGVERRRCEGVEASRWRMVLLSVS